MAEAKNRHGCLTTWLVFIIIVNSLGVLMSLLGRGIISQMLQSQMYQSQMSQSQILQIQMSLNIPVWVFLVSIVFSIFNVVCVIALFLWKKWGFWGYCASSVAALVLNLSVGSSGISQVIYSSLFSLVLVLVLFGVLHIGKKENKGWPQLK